MLPPLDDLPEVKAVWSQIRKLMGSRNLAKSVPVRDLPRVLPAKTCTRPRGGVAQALAA